MSDEANKLGVTPADDLFQMTTIRGFESGQEIFGRFSLVRVLGRGGMGIVWLAHDKQLEQEVAIKVLPEVVRHDREAITDMKGETKRSLQLNHHNIVRIYDFNQDDKGAGISMEFVDGETLSSAKTNQESGCFNVEEITSWIEQICDALAYAHTTAKIVHRDLKPANLMVTKAGVVKVTDFGIARTLSDSISRVSMRHATSGTMVYMSPQQSSGAKPAPSDDIYALGATIFDLLTGKPPFYSGNIQHQLENVSPPSMTERRVDLDRTGTPIPAHWEAAVAACLDKDPKRRPASVRELAEMLQLSNAKGIAAPKLPPPSLPLPAAQPLSVLPLPALPLPALPLPTPQYAPRPPQPTLQETLAPLSRAFGVVPRSIWLGLGGAVVTVTVILGSAFVYDFSVEYFIGHGAIAVNTEPSGVKVVLEDKTGKAVISGTTPLSFGNIWSGDNSLFLLVDGYEPMTVPVQVTKNHVTDTGVLALKRSVGTLFVQSIPNGASCVITMTDSPVSGEVGDTKLIVKGVTPFRTPPLYTGAYSVVISSENYPSVPQGVTIQANSNQTVMSDLIQNNSLHLLGPGGKQAITSNQTPDAALLKDETEKDGLLSYRKALVHDYLKDHQFKLAEVQLDAMATEDGTDISNQKKQLESAQNDWVEDQTATFEKLLKQDKLEQATALLADEQLHITTLLPTKLRDELDQERTLHEEKVAKVMDDFQGLQKAGKLDDAYQLALAQAPSTNNDSRIILALAKMELTMPSTYDRVSNRWKSLDALSSDPDFTTTDPEFPQLCEIFKANFDKHTAFQAQISNLESSGGGESRIAELNADIRHNQAKANGYNILKLGGLFGLASGHSEGGAAAVVGSSGASDREQDIQNDKSEIAEIENRMEASRGQVAAAKANYAAFCQTLIGDINKVN